jgi:hypothetical protein
LLRIILALLSIPAFAIASQVAVTPSPAQAWEPGSIYVSTPKSVYWRDDTWGWIVDFQGRVDPAGWYAAKTIYYKYTYKKNGDVKGTDSESCWYTDGNSCTRRSKEWSLLYAATDDGGDRICVTIKAWQLVGGSQEVSDPGTRCFTTAPPGSPGPAIAEPQMVLRPSTP